MAAGQGAGLPAEFDTPVFAPAEGAVPPRKPALDRSELEKLNYIAQAEGRFAVTGAPEGYDAYLAAEAAQRRKGVVLFVLADDVHAQIGDGGGPLLRARCAGALLPGLGLPAL